MLQNLSQQVRECLQHAEDCAHRAKVEPDPNLAGDFLDMERRWLGLARSWQFSEQLDTFSKCNKKTTQRSRGSIQKAHGGSREVDGEALTARSLSVLC
jgi:hypothetical protein